MAFFLYLGQVVLYAFMMWGIYCLVWRNRAEHRGSRIFLLSSLLLPAALPLIHLPLPAQSVVTPYYVHLPQFVVGRAAIAGSGIVSGEGAALAVYAGISCFLLVLYLCWHVIIFRRLRKGKRQVGNGYAIYTATGIGPATLWRCIFFPADDIQPTILKHELAHIKYGHRLDNFLIQAMNVLFWISPAHWLIGRELRTVHEFEADHLAAADGSTMDYGELLLAQSLGINPHVHIAHSFFYHPLKRRIMMLQKQSSASRRRTAIFKAVFFTAGLLLCGLLIQCRRVPPQQPRTLSKNIVSGSWYEDTTLVDEQGRPFKSLNSVERVYESVDENPEFNGDINEYLMSNLHYPDKARKAGKQGRVGIQFIVDEHGQVKFVQVVKSSGVYELDYEAMRVVSSMPAWKPGKIKGQPVSMFFTIPISFKLN